MGAGLSIRNETPLPLGVILSQLTPLHWNETPLLSGETWNARNEHNVGAVWFTASVDVFDPEMQPNYATVTSRLAGITMGALCTPLAAGFVLGGALSAITSVARGAVMHRVKADGCLLVVRGSCNDGTGEYRLYFSAVERRDATGFVYKRERFNAPPGFRDCDLDAVLVRRTPFPNPPRPRDRLGGGEPPISPAYVVAQARPPVDDDDVPAVTAIPVEPAEERLLHLRRCDAAARASRPPQTAKAPPTKDHPDRRGAKDAPGGEDVVDMDVFELQEAVPEGADDYPDRVDV